MGHSSGRRALNEPGAPLFPDRPVARLVPDGLDATLVLVRHGETVQIVEGRFQGRSETPLSPLGERQAALVGARLARPHAPPALPLPGGPPAAIIHSPLKRSAQTAETIAAAIAERGGFGIAPPVRPEPALVELAQGEWEGLTHAEIAERYGERLAAWRRRPVEAWAPGGESIPDAADRLRPALGTLLTALAAGRPPGTHDRPQVPGPRDPVPGHPWVVLVGHDGVFKVLSLLLFDLPLERFWSLPFVLAGITIVELRAGRPTLRAHNLADHLASLAGSEEPPGRAQTGAL